MEGPVHHRPMGKGKANWGLQKPLPPGCPHLHETAMALLLPQCLGHREHQSQVVPQDISVPAATVTHTVTSRSRHVFILLLCDMVCFSASAKTRVFFWAWIMVQHAH